MGEEGDYLTLHCHHHNGSALTRATVKAILNFNAKFESHNGSVRKRHLLKRKERGSGMEYTPS